MSYAILLVALLTFLTVLNSRRKTRMQFDDLKAKLQELADEVAAIRKSVTDEIARLEDVIAKLQASGIDPTLLEPLTAQVQTTIDNLKGSQSMLDGERPVPVPAQ